MTTFPPTRGAFPELIVRLPSGATFWGFGVD
jgi:hypothetical protein